MTKTPLLLKKFQNNLEKNEITDSDIRSLSIFLMQCKEGYFQEDEHCLEAVFKIFKKEVKREELLFEECSTLDLSAKEGTTDEELILNLKQLRAPKLKTTPAHTPGLAQYASELKQLLEKIDVNTTKDDPAVTKDDPAVKELVQFFKEADHNFNTLLQLSNMVHLSSDARLTPYEFYREGDFGKYAQFLKDALNQVDQDILEEYDLLEVLLEEELLEKGLSGRRMFSFFYNTFEQIRNRYDIIFSAEPGKLVHKFLSEIAKEAVEGNPEILALFTKLLSAKGGTFEVDIISFCYNSLNGEQKDEHELDGKQKDALTKDRKKFITNLLSCALEVCGPKLFDCRYEKETYLKGTENEYSHYVPRYALSARQVEEGEEVGESLFFCQNFLLMEMKKLGLSEELILYKAISSPTTPASFSSDRLNEFEEKALKSLASLTPDKKKELEKELNELGLHKATAPSLKSSGLAAFAIETSAAAAAADLPHTSKSQAGKTSASQSDDGSRVSGKDRLDSSASAASASSASASVHSARKTSATAAAGKSNTSEDERRAALRAGFDNSTTKAQTLGQVAPKLNDPVEKGARVGSNDWKKARLDSFAKAYGGTPSGTIETKGTETKKPKPAKKKPAAEQATPAT